MSDSKQALEGSRAPLEFEGRVALITGATSGLGAAPPNGLANWRRERSVDRTPPREKARGSSRADRNPGKVMFFAAGSQQLQSSEDHSLDQAAVYLGMTKTALKYKALDGKNFSGANRQKVAL
jgi:hypothetical protein